METDAGERHPHQSKMLLVADEKKKAIYDKSRDIKRVKQNFYSQFYLLNGLNKLRNCEAYSMREDLFKNMTETSSVKEETEYG